MIFLLAPLDAGLIDSYMAHKVLVSGSAFASWIERSGSQMHSDQNHVIYVNKETTGARSCRELSD